MLISKTYPLQYIVLLQRVKFVCNFEFPPSFLILNHNVFSLISFIRRKRIQRRKDWRKRKVYEQLDKHIYFASKHLILDALGQNSIR